MFNSGNRTIGYIILVILGVLGNCFNIELLLGIHFIFGSVFIFIIIHYFNFRLAVLAALISGVYTVFLWNNLYGMIYLVIEISVIAALYYKIRKSNTMWAILFFLVIGIPLSYLFSMLFQNFNFTNATLIMLKQGINSLINITIANLLIIVLETSKLIKVQRKISLQEILLNLMLVFFLIPVVFALIIIGRDEFEETKKQIKNDIIETTNKVQINIEQIYTNSLFPLNTVASKINEHGLNKDFEIYTELMQLVSSVPFYEAIYVSDLNGNIVQSYGRNAYYYYEFDFTNSFSESEIHISEPYLSNVFLLKNSSFQAVSITVPIISPKNKVSGYVVGVVDPSTIEQAIENISKSSFAITIMDRNDKVIATNQRDMQGRIDQTLVIKDNEIFFDTAHGKNVEETISIPQEWAELSYSKITQINKDIPWNIHVNVPNRYFASELNYQFIILFISVLLLSGVALIVSFFISKSIQSSFSKITALTTNLPIKIAENETIHWSDMLIKEIADIVSNFKSTEMKLRSMFTELIEAQKELVSLAHYDQLTKLYNKTYLQKHFDELFTKSDLQKMAILFIDLDRFKIVNDTLGHEAGDALLLEVSERIKEVSKENFIISRLGGDEFIILIPEVEAITDVNDVADKMVRALSIPYKVRDNDYFLSASLGISLFPEDGRDLDTLIKNADIAMYTAKDNGKNNFAFYSSEINKDIVSRVVIENELRIAIEKEQLDLYYQPQVNIQTGKIVGMEALIRWQHPTLGFVSPSTFIPVAEETGLIVKIGDWVLNKACNDLKSLQQSGWNSLSMSVNISMIQLLHKNLIPSVENALRKYEISPNHLKLEITESVAMSQPEQVISKLYSLKEIGVNLALDDFGTGYSSLNYLRRLPVDVLKIDREFIMEIEEDKDNITIVKALIEVAHGLDMTVIAEGVETRKQEEILRQINCDQIQGYYYSRPLPLKDLVKLLAS